MPKTHQSLTLPAPGETATDDHHHKVHIIEGKTDSATATQTPQYLYEAGYKCLTAVSMAIGVSQKMGVKLGTEFRYSIKLKFVHVLLREHR